MRNFRKILSILLASLMLFSCVGFTLAGALTNDFNHNPQVYVQGFESKWIYYKDDPEKKSLLFPIDTNRLLGNFGNYAAYAEEAIKNLNPDLAYAIVYGALWDSFGPTALKPDGYTMQDEVTVDPTVLKYEGDGNYTFKYDARLDPVDVAKELHEYIGWVQEDTGMQTIELVGSSYGTSVVVAYLYEYGWENIDSVLLCVPSLEGVNFVGELFSGTFNLDPDAVESFVSGMITDETINLLISVLNDMGALDIILELLLEPVLQVAVMRALTDIIHDVFGTHPAMWAFVEDEYFYDALENIYGEDWNEETEEYRELIDKVVYFHENIKVKDREIMQAAIDDGVHMNIICKYNKAPFPFSEDGNFQGDGFVDLGNASLGATAAMLGETLPEDYVQQNDTDVNHISPDRIIDASTCFLPNNTWFIKNLAHGEKTDPYYAILDRIVYEDLDVFTDPNLPQFLVCNEDGSITALGEEEPVKEYTFFEKLFMLFSNLFRMIVDGLKNLFAGA